MCIILDANCMTDFLDCDKMDMEPVRRWLRERGKIAYAPTEEFQKEMIGKFRPKIDELRRAGQLKQFSANTVDATQKNLPPYQSDDPHIIALGLVVEVKVLVSYDEKLGKDFGKINNGKIYKRQSHSHLLKRDLCP